MNREAMRAAADREGIKPTSYSFEGGTPDQTYVLSIEPGGWAVYFAERGERVDEERFDTEDEACHELLLRLIRDPTTRRW